MATNGNNILIGMMNGNTFIAFAGVKSHEWQSACETIETANPDSGQWRTFVPGRCSWQANLSYLVLENANSNIEDLLKVGQTVTLCQRDRNGQYQLKGTAICTNCKQTYIRGNLSQGSYQFQGSGEMISLH